ncbi:hypothetical protein CAOG_009875 [Capsaspora owczarzaki ATCC 30864]|uniref:Uncharacterized protein n=1 Tax=Capsaspora owczarzaki (strain ATCC 30864) TaxID=595528 RepID=A0A0D2UJ76_CAPO3|nr:hypothetical protein CAOG_009875 [Capsaspora owczarzaki ATCC 30864]
MAARAKQRLQYTHIVQRRLDTLSGMEDATVDVRVKVGARDAHFLFCSNEVDDGIVKRQRAANSDDDASPRMVDGDIEGRFENAVAKAHVRNVTVVQPRLLFERGQVARAAIVANIDVLGGRGPRGVSLGIRNVIACKLGLVAARGALAVAHVQAAQTGAQVHKEVERPAVDAQGQLTKVVHFRKVGRIDFGMQAKAARVSLRYLVVNPGGGPGARQERSGHAARGRLAVGSWVVRQRAGGGKPGRQRARIGAQLAAASRLCTIDAGGLANDASALFHTLPSAQNGQSGGNVGRDDIEVLEKAGQELRELHPNLPIAKRRLRGRAGGEIVRHTAEEASQLGRPRFGVRLGGAVLGARSWVGNRTHRIKHEPKGDELNPDQAPVCNNDGMQHIGDDVVEVLLAREAVLEEDFVDTPPRERQLEDAERKSSQEQAWDGFPCARVQDASLQRGPHNDELQNHHDAVQTETSEQVRLQHVKPVAFAVARRGVRINDSEARNPMMHFRLISKSQ